MRKVGYYIQTMSFAEAAFDAAPPLGRPFDFSKALAGARKLLVKRVWPNLQDGADLVYRKTAATGVATLSFFFWLDKITDFDEADYPVPPRVQKQEGRRRSSYGVPMAAATFMAALLAPTSFTTRTHVADYEPDFTIVSQSRATEPEAVPEYAVIDSDEWRANRARLLAAYAERRASMHPVEVAPVYETAHQELNGVQVTSAFGGDEYEDRGY